MIRLSFLLSVLSLAPVLVHQEPVLVHQESVLVHQDAKKPAKETDGAKLVKVALLADRETIRAGETFTLGVRLTIRKGWHVYWENAGDSGIPTTLEVHAPEGFEIGGLHFPVPEKQVLEGDIVSYIHKDEVVILADVKVPAKLTAASPASPISKVKFDVDANWLVCTEYCLAGSGKAEIEISAGETSKPTNEKLFADARGKLPRAWKELAEDFTTERKLEDGEVRIVWTVKGAKTLEFYSGPGRSPGGSSALKKQTVEALEGAARITLAYPAPSADNKSNPSARGILRVARAEGMSFYEVDDRGHGLW